MPRLAIADVVVGVPGLVAVGGTLALAGIKLAYHDMPAVRRLNQMSRGNPRWWLARAEDGAARVSSFAYGYATAFVLSETVLDRTDGVNIRSVAIAAASAGVGVVSARTLYRAGAESDRRAFDIQAVKPHNRSAGTHDLQ